MAGGGPLPHPLWKRLSLLRQPRRTAGFNDLATLYPELAAEWHPTKNGALTPEQVLAGSEKRVWWQCGRGHAWQTSVSTRTRANCRCPVCAGRTVLAGENDLATLSPELAAEWHPTLNGALTPDMVTAGSNKRVWWQCRLGHVWRAVVARPEHGMGRGAPTVQIARCWRASTI